jgi:predicted TPR repeat methyltransferase
LPVSKIDEDALAAAYGRALKLEKAGRLDEAAEAYAEVLALDPDDHGGAVVRLAAMKRGAVPAKAPDAYVATLFDQHAEVFEDILVDDLGYCVPLLVRQMLGEAAPGPYVRLLDLGCGTGLTGVALEDMAAHLTGVDLSDTMVDVAGDKEVYDVLYAAEVVRFLDEIEAEPWDLVTATDMLPYLGDVVALFGGVARHMAPGGVWVFSTETLPGEAFDAGGYTVGPFQRFAHRLDYLHAELARAGFAAERVDDIIVRHEDGAPIAGHLILARRAG